MNQNKKIIIEAKLQIDEERKNMEKILSERIEAILNDKFLNNYSEKQKEEKKARAKELKENKDKFNKKVDELLGL